MSSEIKKKIELEIVHVLFLDVVGYSKRLTNEQNALIDQLNQIVRSSDEFKRAEAADRLIKIPTGDGMALVFYKSPEQPVECALEISRALKAHPELGVRMGVHSGPVSAVTDLNDRANAAGIGINIAQRVMDCGDAGHILLSKRVAEDLEQDGNWQPQLHDLGEVEVKHGVRVHVFNLYSNELGNPEVPEKVRLAKAQAERASAAPLVRRERRAFVGRDVERARLDQMLKDTKEGRGGLVLLGGEPGVGKTRLANEILEDGRERGLLALAGHAYEEETAPWVTGREILQEMVRLLPPGDLRKMLGENAPELSRLMPELRRLFRDIPEPEELPPQQQQRYLFKNVAEFLVRATRATPMVMLLDDIQWADESSMMMLEYIAPRLPEMGVLMIGTYRDIEAEMGAPFTKTMATLVRQRVVETIQIKQFDETSVAELLTALAGAEPPAKLAKAIHRETEGNAFFVEEVFRHLSEEGSLFDEEGRWKSDLDLENLDVPQGVRLVTARRLERLREGTVKMLTNAAGVGLRFELRILEAASTEPEAVIDEVEEAEAAQLIEPSGGSREARYEFSHALVRQTLLSGLSVPRLQRLHLRLADAMERAYGAKVEEHAAELAYQLDEAGATAAPGRVRRYLILAGDQARAAVATEEALDYYKKALELAEGLDSAERADFLFKRGEASRALGRWDEAEADWHEALPALESNGKTELVTHICHELSYQASWQNRRDYSKTIVTRGLKSAGEKVSAGRCRLLAMLGHLTVHDGDFDRGDELLCEATAMAESLGDESLLASLPLHRIYYYEHSLQPTKMVEAGERAIELARRSGRPWDLSSALGVTCLGLCFLGQFDRFRAVANEAEPLALQEGDLGTLAHVQFLRGLPDLAEGNLSAARDTFDRSVKAWREAGIPWVTLIQVMLGAIELAQGDWSAARTELEDAVAHPLIGSFGWLGESGLLRLLSYSGDNEAVALLDQLAAQLPRLGVTNGLGPWYVLMASVESAALLGRREQVAALYPLMQQLMAGGLVDFLGMGLVEKVAGIAATAGRAWQDAETHFENALRTANEIPHRVEQPEVRRWYARMLLDRNEPDDRERARALLTEARAAYEKIGMPKHVEMVDALLKEADTR